MQGHLSGHSTQFLGPARRGGAPAVLCKTAKALPSENTSSCLITVFVFHIKRSHVPCHLHNPKDRERVQFPHSACLAEAHRIPSDQVLPPGFSHLFLPSSSVRDIRSKAAPSFAETCHISASESWHQLSSYPRMPFSLPSAPTSSGESSCLILLQSHMLTPNSSQSLSSSFQVQRSNHMLITLLLIPFISIFTRQTGGSRLVPHL